MIIKIDDREPMGMEDKMSLVDDEVLMLRCRMECGDYVWEDVCVERKEINDFCSSIMDGRIKSQVEKMKREYRKRFVIIVGRISDRTCEIDENCVLGKITSLVIKHGINVICVDNEWQFLYTIKSIFEKYELLKDKKFIKKQIEELQNE